MSENISASAQHAGSSEQTKGFIAIEGASTTAVEAIRLCGAALESAGYVTDAFAQGCIDREANYPTGICTQIPVALALQVRGYSQERPMLCALGRASGVQAYG